VGPPTQTWLLGATQAQAPWWAKHLQTLAPQGAQLTGWDWDTPAFWQALTETPWPTQRHCLLLVHLGSTGAEGTPTNEARVRAWLAQAGQPHRLFYLDLDPPGQTAATEARLLRGLGWTRLSHRNNHAVWQCNGCSDPGCEQRLFGDRLLNR